MAPTKYAALLLVAAGCRAGPRDQPGHLYATIVQPPHDTVRFSAVGFAHRCGRGGWLWEGHTGGNGVLIWTRAPASVGELRLLTRGDSVTPRGAMVATRFMVGDGARGVTLDSGAVTLDSTARGLSARAAGTGLDAAAGHRVRVEAWFDSIPAAADTVTCRVQI